MPNELGEHFNRLLTSLLTAETEQKNRYYNAIDIEDMKEATSVTIDARNKIQQLRKWIEEIQRINKEVDAAYKLTAEQEGGQKEQHITIEPEIVQEALFESDTFDGSESLDNENLKGVIICGKTYSVNNWHDLLTKLCETMVLKKPYEIINLSFLPVSSSGQRIISLDEQKISGPHSKLSNGFYITTSGNVNEIRKRCEYILKACGYNSDMLQIY